LESACHNLCDVEHASVIQDFPVLKGLDCGADDFQTVLKKAGIQYFRAV
jgi:hypothetical protein